MKRIAFSILLLLNIISCGTKNEIIQSKENARFNSSNDLLLLNYDCKTDVDDLHSIAAAASLLRIPEYSKLNYHAVAGSYGTQEGKYVNANALFSLAFNENWSDAHANYEKALNEVYSIVGEVLNGGGNVWIAEAGQSDFSSGIVSKVQKEMGQIDTKKRIHIVQHSDWNEKVTTVEKLAFVKKHCNYHKIPDGNALNNGTPGYNTSDIIDWENIVKNREIKGIWQLATTISDKYNGVENRYLNKSIKAGGMDFSDFCEVHYILKLDGLDNCEAYFDFIQSRL